MISSDKVELLRGGLTGPRNLFEHQQAFGTLPTNADLIAQLSESGLTGRGGAGFSTATKAALIQSTRGRQKRVVVNAMEGEPASHKVRSLLGANPHLVLDGATALARAVGARDVTVAVARENATTVENVRRSIRERTALQVRMELVTPPGRYVAGEESALVNWLNENETLPMFRPVRPAVLHVGKTTVLVVNAETLAHVALIARFGPQWFRSRGANNHPGTTLVSVSGGVRRPVVLEIPLGLRLEEILARGEADPFPQALLLGGYGGAWVRGDRLDVAYSNETLNALGASVGAGVFIALPHSGCGIAETSAIVGWMAHESAHQCGPCAFGLPSAAADLALLARGAGGTDALDRLRQRMLNIEGRGACRHPDGVVHLIRSALTVFATDLSRHAAGQPCRGAASPRFAIVPSYQRDRELVWQ